MTKTLTYPAFAVAGLIIFAVFATAQTYLQLAVAIVLYPALVFLAFMIFPRKSWKVSPVTFKPQPKSTQNNMEILTTKKETTYVADIDRRTFIKLIGATGISFFLVSLFGRQVENLIFGRADQAGSNASGGNQSGPSGTSPTEGYKISEIDEGPVSYYGFINKDGAWLVMQEADDGSSFRYAKGDSSFSENWKNRENLSYDYFNNLF